MEETTRRDVNARWHQAHFGTDTPAKTPPHTEALTRTSAEDASVRQAYGILRAGFIAAPTIAGLDKFTHLLTNWDQYLAPQVAALLPVSGHTFMQAVGVVEIAAGLLVAAKPRIGALVVAGWLGGIVVNLLLTGSYFDIALRDFGLMLGALALGRLASSRAQHRAAV